MSAAKAMGAAGAAVISYANSGDLPIGDSDRVVGYGAVAFTEERFPAAFPDEETPISPARAKLSDADKKALLAFARKSITQFMNSQTIPLARGFSPSVRNPQGVFVTLKKRGNLRGCIGHIIPDGTPLCRLVGSMALQSAFNDNRFPPVSASEMKDIEIELSVLTPMKSVAGPEDIVVGRDGVIIHKDGRSAVFLPQVAPEQGWNREEMLKHLCIKAGLPHDGWRSGAQFSTFEAIVFSESELK